MRVQPLTARRIRDRAFVVTPCAQMLLDARRIHAEARLMRELTAMRVMANPAGDRQMFCRILLDVVGLHIPGVEYLLTAMTLLAFGASGRAGHRHRVTGPAPLLHERVMDAIVTLAAPISEPGVDTHRSERLDRVRILHVRQARTMT